MQPLLVRLGLNAKDFNAGFLEARKNLQDIKKNTDELSKSMQSMNKVAKLAFSAWGIYNVREALQSLVRYVGEVSVELDRMKRSMNAATGSISLGAHAIQFLQQESQRLGLQFRDQIQGFQQLAAAAKGTSLTYKDVREVWLGISEASTVMQLSSEQNKYALYALQQMISKGVVTMEELRRQLGDQIPG
ncbi:MAG: tape measure protein, partial [Nitrosarchaeum sp.]